MIGLSNHLHDDRLFDCYLAERAGESADLPASEHLLDCEQCATRYADFASFLDALRAEADAETDAVFTADRLWAQQQQIMKRVEHVGCAARVLSFPGRVGRQMVGATTRVTPRWLAAAAAAGLFVGVAVGGLFYSPFHARPAELTMARSKTRRLTQPPPIRVTSPASVLEATPAVTVERDDDNFMFELENALQHPRTRELMPYDALTPHARDISELLR